MQQGCDHCGTVVRRQSKDGPATCQDCGRPLRGLDPLEARTLVRERRIAEQFRRVARLQRTVEAGRALRPQ
jgi:ribosomal protein L34E